MDFWEGGRNLSFSDSFSSSHSLTSLLLYVSPTNHPTSICLPGLQFSLFNYSRSLCMGKLWSNCMLLAARLVPVMLWETHKDFEEHLAFLFPFFQLFPLSFWQPPYPHVFLCLSLFLTDQATNYLFIPHIQSGLLFTSFIPVFLHSGDPNNLCYYFLHHFIHTTTLRLG